MIGSDTNLLILQQYLHLFRESTLETGSAIYLISYMDNMHKKG